MPWRITLDNSKGISRLRFWAKNHRVNEINDLPVFMHQGIDDPVLMRIEGCKEGGGAWSGPRRSGESTFENNRTLR